MIFFSNSIKCRLPFFYSTYVFLLTSLINTTYVDGACPTNFSDGGFTLRANHDLTLFVMPLTYLEAGVDLLVLQNVLGHVSILTTVSQGDAHTQIDRV